MKASKKCFEQLQEWEGFRAEAYRCPAGVWTIGFGHTSGVKEGDKITREEAEELFRKDLVKYEQAVEALLKRKFKSPSDFSQGTLDSMISFAYNAGHKNLFESKWFGLICEGRVNEAKDALEKWGSPQWKVAPGLKKRRKIESTWLS